jgi:hypothetical protein
MLNNQRRKGFGSKVFTARRAPTRAKLAEAVPFGTDISIDGVGLVVMFHANDLPATLSIMQTDHAHTLLEVADRFGCSLA